MDALDWLETALDAPAEALADQLAADPRARERVAALLERAAQHMRSDPGRGRLIAELGLAVALRIEAAELIPQARYTAARAYALNADYETAAGLISEARDGYLALGARLEALRTTNGLVHVLREQGRYEEALAVGHATLAAAAELADDEDRAFLTAIIQQNLGLCYEQTGHYEAALEAYAEAEASYWALGMTEAIGEIGTNRGVVLLALGRPTKALLMFEQSAELFANAGLTLLHATTLINIGNAHLLLGQFTRSLAVFEQARRLFETLEAQADAHVLLLDTGDAYMALNRYPEALAAYREAAARLRDAAMPHDLGRALWGAGNAQLALQQLEAAATALDEAAALFLSTGNHALLSGVLLERAALLATQRDRDSALALAERALALASAQEWPVQQFYAHLRLADLRAADLVCVEEHLLAARRVVAQLALPHLFFRIEHRLGALRRRQGRVAEARELLLSAIAQIEQLRGAVASEVLRISFLQDKVAVYEDLLRLQLDHDPAGGGWAALVTAERARARALADRLGGAGEGAPAASAELEALQADLHAVYTELLAYGGAPQAPARAASLRARAAELEQLLTLEHLRAAPALPDPLAAPLTADELRQRLGGPAGVLVYHVLGDEIMAFVIVGGELTVARRLSSVTRIEPQIARLASQWERFTAGPAFVERYMPQLERSARHVLAALYEELLAPVAELLARIPGAPRRLAIVPHGLLHQIPFHALYDGQRYLIDAYEVLYGPSVTALALGGEQAPLSRRVLVVGVDDPLIPLVAEEVGAIAAHLPAAELLIGAEATAAAVRERAPGCAVLHLACHGVFRSDNPLFSSLQLADAWLTAREIAQLDLRGALVAMGACESGRGRVYDGDEVIGLPRAFLAAGARALLGSLWLVQDASTARLMEHWYGAMVRGRTPAAALREAQLAVRELAAHPFYWAPFFLVGRRRPVAEDEHEPS